MGSTPPEQPQRDAGSRPQTDRSKTGFRREIDCAPRDGRSYGPPPGTGRGRGDPDPDRWARGREAHRD